MLFICVSKMQPTYKTMQLRSLIYILSGGVNSWIWPDSYLHHQLPRGENHLWALRAGAEDLPESQGEVPGEEHCPGLWVREGTRGAVQTCGRAPLFASGVHWWTLPRGESLLLSEFKLRLAFPNSMPLTCTTNNVSFLGCWENPKHEWVRRASGSSN